MGMPLLLRRYASTIPHQAWIWAPFILGANLALAGVLILLDLRYGIDYWDLVRDTNAIAGQPAYFGFYSNLGVLLWAVAASIALFGWTSLVSLSIADRRSTALLLGGLFAAIACLDDLFMLHEHAYLIGIPEKVVLSGYALLLLAFATAALPDGHRTQWAFLAASLTLLALSTLFDMLDLPIPGSVLIEEVLKLSGIAFLAAYLVTLSFSTLTEHRRAVALEGTPAIGETARGHVIGDIGARLGHFRKEHA
jgi:hypothetical protein